MVTDEVEKLLKRTLLKRCQLNLLQKLEQDISLDERERLLLQLEWLEALGDRQKGLLTADQKLLLFSTQEYQKCKQTKTDQEIYENIGVSRRSFYLWKRQKGLLTRKKAK
ncbi:hypothetical protein [Listeria sp. PSOL-1]|uniref:hypothetical protein n=1 Tax=Listeria sp. PSOL-1 TaxID=1844999 RepID=UPI0013D156F5|nr:hypothetical protein [Listeria sp. PSOL-1]